MQIPFVTQSARLVLAFCSRIGQLVNVAFGPVKMAPSLALQSTIFKCPILLEFNEIK